MEGNDVQWTRFEDEKEPDEDIHLTVDRLLSEANPDAIVFTDLQEALIGIVTQQYRSLALYDYDKIIDIFMKRDGMTYEEAIEFCEFNTVGTWAGEYTPIIVHREEILPFEPITPTECAHEGDE